ATETQLNYIIEKIDNVMLPFKGVSEETATKLKTEITKIKTKLNETSAKEVSGDISTLIVKINDLTFEKASAKTALTNELKASEKIARLSRDDVTSKVDFTKKNTDSKSDIGTFSPSNDKISTGIKIAAGVLTGIVIVAGFVISINRKRKKKKGKDNK
ncbi:MAG: hypothetical protein K0S55_1598, partial [Clostridia bacterium]|nr:hypothetical protein [Clostridia bacterium]